MISTEVNAPLYWIEGWDAVNQRWLRLHNCDYGDRAQAENRASERYYNESEILRVVEIRETVTRRFYQ